MSLKALMVGHGGSSPGSYLANPTSPNALPLCRNYHVSKCPSASIALTSTLRVNLGSYHANVQELAGVNEAQWAQHNAINSTSKVLWWRPFIASFMKIHEVPGQLLQPLCNDVAHLTLKTLLLGTCKFFRKNESIPVS